MIAITLATQFFQTTVLSLAFISVPSYLGWKALVMEDSAEVEEGAKVEDSAEESPGMEDRASPAGMDQGAKEKD